MNNLTLLETILIIYILAVNVLGVITIITARYASEKVNDVALGILLVVAIPIILPIVLCQMLVDKLKRKRKQNLEKQFDDFFKENENDK